MSLVWVYAILYASGLLLLSQSTETVRTITVSGTCVCVLGGGGGRMATTSSTQLLSSEERGKSVRV